MHTVRENLGIEPDADQDSANYRNPDFAGASESRTLIFSASSTQ